MNLKLKQLNLSTFKDLKRQGGTLSSCLHEMMLNNDDDDDYDDDDTTCQFVKPTRQL